MCSSLLCRHPPISDRVSLAACSLSFSGSNVWDALPPSLLTGTLLSSGLPYAVFMTHFLLAPALMYVRCVCATAHRAVCRHRNAQKLSSSPSSSRYIIKCKPDAMYVLFQCYVFSLHTHDVHQTKSYVPVEAEAGIISWAREVK